MISTIAIVIIFLQIFICGIAIAGANSFFIKYIEKRKKEDHYLALIFLCIALHTALIVISQMAYTLGASTLLRFIIYRIISIIIVLGSLFIALFLKNKFNMKDSQVFNGFMLLVAVETLLILRSPINIVANIKDIALDPGVQLLSALPPDIFWNLLWLILGIKLLYAARAAKDVGSNKILNLAGASSIAIVVAFAISLYYVVAGEAYYLAVYWSIYLFAVIGFFLGNIISPKDEVAKFPLSYFRTRILYKLILMFLLLIIILLEATTIATINLNQISLQKAIKSNFINIARNIADKVEGESSMIDYSDSSGSSSFVTYGRGRIDRATIQKVIEGESVGNRIVYVVSKDGKLYASRDPNEVGKDMSMYQVVKNVLAGQYGSDEYYSEFFTEVQNQYVLGAYAPVKKYGMGVIVEEPKWYVYSEIRVVSTDTLIFVIIGIIMTVSVGIFFAKSIESSIKQVISGTEAVSKGDLSYKIKIDSMDEIGQLANAFNLMTKELKLTQDQLISSEKLASLGTMAAGMAHEIKNPLVSLRTFTQLLPQRFEDEEFRKKFVIVVPQEIDKINKIAESLLRFGRPHKPQVTTVNLNDVLDEILALFDNEARKNNVRVTTKFAEVPKIEADAGQLSQAFVNIILNAIQAMSPNGGELTVKTDTGEIIKLKQSSALSTDEEAKPIPVIFIEISDTGSGIPDDNLKKIFDPFFTTKEVGGTGMGLPITLRIIEEHGGSINVQSQMGKGTKFLITLPQTPAKKV